MAGSSPAEDIRAGAPEWSTTRGLVAQSARPALVSDRKKSAEGAE
jgi:hypothetical protein